MGRPALPWTLERIQGRCQTTVDGCWVWQGSLGGENHPVVTVNRKNKSTRKLALELKSGRRMEARVAKNTCGVDLCVNHDHHVAVTKARASVLQNEYGQMNNKGVLHGIRSTKKARATGLYKLDKAKVLQLREDYSSGAYPTYKLLAEKWGISEKHAADIINFRRWKVAR